MFHLFDPLLDVGETFRGQAPVSSTKFHRLWNYISCLASLYESNCHHLYDSNLSSHINWHHKAMDVNGLIKDIKAISHFKPDIAVLLLKSNATL